MIRARGLMIAAVAATACGGPRFHHAGPATPSPIEIDRITLKWSNVYLVKRGDAAVLVDSGSPVDREALAAALVARGTPPAKIKAVVITHAHADHAGCARWLQQQGAAIVLGAGDVAPAGRGMNEPLRPTGLLGALLATVFMFPFDPFTPELAVDHELDLSAYGFPELTVVPVAGHTPGSVAVLLGTEAFTGDMVKGGELFQQSPVEHLYQTDRLADHRALAGLIARGVTRMYLGHSGPLTGADVADWLETADERGHDNAVAIELDLRGELPRGGALGDLGGSIGLRSRYVLGRGPGGLGYAVGLDLRGGYSDGGYFEGDLHPIGFAARSTSGMVFELTGGVGIGGARGIGATHALVELGVELPAGPVRLLGRAAAGWRLGGARYADDVAGIADEATALLGVRLGRDRRWGDFIAGKGPFLAVAIRDLGGAQLFGIALGAELFAGR